MTLQAQKDVNLLLTIQEQDANTAYIFVEGPENYNQNVIRIHKHNNYIFSFKQSINDIYDEDQVGIIRTKQETLDFLMKIRYYQIFDRFNNKHTKYSIVDYNNDPFLVTKRLKIIKIIIYIKTTKKSY